MEKEKQKKTENSMYAAGICIFFVLLAGFLICRKYAALLKIFYMPCWFQKWTGIYCFGCGGTRAVRTLLKGNCLLSVCYHPLVFYIVVLYGWYMLSHTIEKISSGKLCIGMRYRNFYTWLALLILVVNTAIKDIALLAFHIDILQILDQSAFL